MISKESPPPSKQFRGTFDWQAAVSEMKASPQEFYRLGKFSPGIAHFIRTGEYKAFLDDTVDVTDLAAREEYMDAHWEVTTRSHGAGRNPNQVTLYVRWLG
jgi:antirestriction protein ArdC